MLAKSPGFRSIWLPSSSTHALIGGLTVTTTAVLVVIAPRLSVARAVRLWAPTVVGVHENEYGLVVSAPRLVVDASKNSTLATLSSLSAAVAVSTIATPVVPMAGAVSVTVGGRLVTGAGSEPPPQAARTDRHIHIPARRLNTFIMIAAPCTGLRGES